MKVLFPCCVFLYFVVFVTSETVNEDSIRNDTKNDSIIEISGDTLKKVMWKRCSNSSYVTCAKLALVHVIEKLDSSDGYTLLPGISVLKRTDNAARFASDEVVVRNDFNEALDKYLLTKIRRYLSSLTLSVKLLDRNAIDDMRSFGDIMADSNKETGRGKKKYMHSLLMAGWMSGATLLALTMKTIAILSGKALLAALLSLMLSVISAFSGKHHAESKSTTYEIITKPIVAHTHAADVHEAHGSELNPSYAYKRSIGPEIILRTTNLPSEEIEHIIRKIGEQPSYYPPLEFSKS